MVDMGELRFIGFKSTPAVAQTGNQVSIGIYWRARAKPRGDYMVVVQLRDANGNVAFEHATRPANNSHPTTQWDEGEVLLDWHDFVLPRNLPVGKYQGTMVLRDAVSNANIGEVLISTVSVVE